MLIEPLTKENFWDEINTKYPEGVKKFLAWFDEHKKEINFPTLNFYDLPFSFQFGIWYNFASAEIGYNLRGAMINSMDLILFAIEGEKKLKDILK